MKDYFYLWLIILTKYTDFLSCAKLNNLIVLRKKSIYSFN